jgi:DNA-binding GntR family transcriptional regulator
MPVTTEADRIVDELINAILEGKYKPGEQLVQRKVAEDFQVATITVREAFHRLSPSGLIEVTPKVGAHVVELNFRKIREIYYVRMALEGMSARLAALEATNSEKQRLNRFSERLDEMLNSPKRFEPEAIKLHSQFHLDLAAASHNDYLQRLIENLMLVRVLWHNSEWHKRRLVTRKIRNHDVLMKAILENDAEAAESILRDDIYNGLLEVEEAEEQQALG